MSGIVKAILLLAGLLLLAAIVAAGVGWYWWSHHGEQLVEAARKANLAGASFGKTTDDQGCVSEALSRARSGAGFSEAVALNLFLKACLRASRPTDGFCDGVPKRSDIVESVKWQVDRCSRIAPGVKECSRLMGQIEEFCEGR